MTNESKILTMYLSERINVKIDNLLTPNLKVYRQSSLCIVSFFIYIVYPSKDLGDKLIDIIYYKSPYSKMNSHG
jgi:hypothetical protein